MVKEDYVFANLNAFAIRIPNERRVSRTISPREVVRGSWYSRFQGENQLTKIDDPDLLKPVERLPNPLPKGCTACESGCQAGCENSLEGLQDLEHAKLVAGTYFCKHCAYNNTKEGEFNRHLEREHPELFEEETPDTEEKDSTDAPESPSDDSESILASDTVDNTEEEGETLKNDPIAPEPKTVEEETAYYWLLDDGRFQCKECASEGKEKTSTSKSGISRHINANHR